MSEAAQVRNAQNIDILAGEFQRRRDPLFSFSRSVSTLQGLLGIKGVWPMSFTNGAGDAIDVGPNTLDLAAQNTPLFGRSGIAPYADLDTGDYFSSNALDDAFFDVLGTESYIATAYRGLTFGGWFYIDAVGSGDKFLLCKWQSSAANRSYALYHNGTTLTFGVYDTGNTLFSVNSSDTISTSTWFYAAGRYDPSTEIEIHHNTTRTSNTTTIPASLFNSSAVFAAGARSDGSNGIDGRVSMCYLCAADIGSSIAQAVFHATRHQYGV